MESFESFAAVSRVKLRKDERESQGSVSSGPGEEVILFDLVFVSVQSRWWYSLLAVVVLGLSELVGGDKAKSRANYLYTA